MIGTTKHIWITATLLFFISFAVYNANMSVYNTGDNLATRLIPISIIENKSVFMDKLFPTIIPQPNQGLPYYTLRVKGGHIVSEKATAMAIFITPVYVVAYKFFVAAGIPHDLTNPDFNKFLNYADKFTASSIAAIAVVLFFFVAFLMFKRKRVAFVTTLIYAFATNHWATSSQGIWVHGGVEFWLLSSIFGLLLFEHKKNRTFLYWSAFSAATLYTMRVTGLFYLIAVTFYVWRYHKNRIYEFLVIPLIIVSAYSTFNLVELGSLLGGYADIAHKPFWDFGFFQNILALGGMFFSPGRGLFFYTPITIFSFISMIQLLKNKELREENRFLSLMTLPAMAIIAVSTVYTDNNMWLKWYGGYCYGPRYFVDILPVLILLLPICYSNLSLKGMWKNTVTVFAVAFILWSLFTQVVGAFYDKGIWNVYPESIDLNPIRVWDLKNNPILVELQTGIKPDTKDRLDRILGVYTLPQSVINNENAKASIIPLTELKDMSVGGTQMLSVRINNLGGELFSSHPDTKGRYQVNVAYHWIDQSGNTVIFDGIRTHLPTDIHPGKSVELKMMIQGPPKSGSYILELDLVQEGAFWFKDKGVETVKLPVTIK